ncbi:hypothetical protein CHLRE_09g402304v5 [Chlamydomonas reinhardtii]|uniref:Uncharacterized protein n=1 Tax=Chlamydomonas reinhardtii TaxID=3055 RepID=A0A2K3DCQ5_CHLRE|nr:uncharacterized protein CHLRE_09g402304v5 [Chlamydomonas reinhardtii]PNW78316.1 hypothetical protein CHLRE_09g402304v5 [Chlamydomonas reinhardtii]
MPLAITGSPPYLAFTRPACHTCEHIYDPTTDRPDDDGVIPACPVPDSCPADAVMTAVGIPDLARSKCKPNTSCLQKPPESHYSTFPLATFPRPPPTCCTPWATTPTNPPVPGNACYTMIPTPSSTTICASTASPSMFMRPAPPANSSTPSSGLSPSTLRDYSTLTADPLTPYSGLSEPKRQHAERPGRLRTSALRPTRTAAGQPNTTATYCFNVCAGCAANSLGQTSVMAFYSPGAGAKVTSSIGAAGLPVSPVWRRPCSTPASSSASSCTYSTPAAPTTYADTWGVQQVYQGDIKNGKAPIAKVPIGPTANNPNGVHLAVQMNVNGGFCDADVPYNNWPEPTAAV